jgi:hypothetical protein
VPIDPNTTVLMESVRIVYRNFAGKEGPYNREGDRNFSVVLDEEVANAMEADGWNIKRKPGREEGEGDFITLPVSVKFKGRPPKIVMITSRGRTDLDEDLIEMLDYADIKNVDMIVRPYEWVVNGKTGVKAYLKSIFVTINEDELDLKYADVPDAGEKDFQNHEDE